MPKRSNTFQKVMYLLQRELAQTALVVESDMVRNSDTGAQAEVDITVTTEVGNIPIVIGVECTDTKRPASIEWIQRMYGKHHPLPIDVTVLVSRAGFTKNALEQAEAFRIQTMTLADAENTDWSDIIDDLKALALGNFSFTMRNATIHYDRSPAAAPDLILKPDLQVRGVVDGRSINLSDLFSSLVSDRRVARSFMDWWLKTSKDARQDEVSFTLDWKPQKETVIAVEKFLYRVSQIDLGITASISTTRLEMQAGIYGTSRIAYGVASNIFSGKKGDVVITLARNEAGLSTGSIMIPDFDAAGDKIVSVTLEEPKHQNVEVSSESLESQNR